ncbi:hypothetical protein F4861DRAFT_523270 [Xylaria intraflava]|nr:hypothetical protein F4861DRAFT_523270 [Xylaria intraflava]
MSDQSDSEDQDFLGGAGFLNERDSDASDSDREGNALIDLEAAESGDDDNDADDDADDIEDQYYDDDDDDEDDEKKQYFFPQFSRLPLEIRTMIWEAVDPYLLSEARVFNFVLDGNFRKLQPIKMIESGNLSFQTAPARALLATNQESRRIALKHYPDVVPFRDCASDLRFRASTDIVHLGSVPDLQVALGFTHYARSIRYLALNTDPVSFPFSWGSEHPPAWSPNLKALFYCLSPMDLRGRHLDWAVAESSKKFILEIKEEHYDPFKEMYCWPDVTRHKSFADSVSADYLAGFPELPPVPSVPTWPMALFNYDDFRLYRQLKRKYGSGASQDDGSDESEYSSLSDLPSSSSESDNGFLDGFIVPDDGVMSGFEESSGEEIDGFDSDSGESSLPDEGHSQSGQNSYNFGLSLHSESTHDDEAEGNDLPDVTSDIPELLEDHVSEASSDEEQSYIEKAHRRLKRRIISSDDEGGDGDGARSEAKSGSRLKKRSRVILSDDEDNDDDDDGGGGGAVSELESSRRTQKRKRVILSDDDDNDNKGDGTGSEEADYSPVKKRARVLPSDQEDTKDDGEQPETDEEESEEQDDDEEGGPAFSKPVSLQARLRQFRSEIPSSPEEESLNSAEEDEEDEEDQEDEEEQELSDDEFPGSPDEYEEDA